MQSLRIRKQVRQIWNMMSNYWKENSDSTLISKLCVESNINVEENVNNDHEIIMSNKHEDSDKDNSIRDDDSKGKKLSVTLMMNLKMLSVVLIIVMLRYQ